MTTRLIRSLETSAGRVPVASRARPVASTPGAEARLRKARMADAGAIQDLVAIFADRDEMLHRSLGEIHEHIRDYFVIEEGDREATVARLVGCVALHVNLDQLAEIKALAVAEECQGKGYGKRLVLACLDEGRDLGLGTVFALTYRPGFFEKLGFRVVDKATLPHKVWTECIRCPKFPDCGEIAVVRDL
jgi:amino-acid N-acetyltransferase